MELHIFSIFCMFLSNALVQLCDFNTVNTEGWHFIFGFVIVYFEEIRTGPFKQLVVLLTIFFGKNQHLHILTVYPFFIVQMQQLKENQGQFR